MEREGGKGLSDGASKEVKEGAETSKMARLTGLQRYSLSFAPHWACLSRLPSASSPSFPSVGFPLSFYYWKYLSLGQVCSSRWPWTDAQLSCEEPMPVQPDPPGSAAP